MAKKKIIEDLTKIRFTVTDTMQYETPDDYTDEGEIMLYSGLTENDRLAVGVHAFIEKILCNLKGINAKQITAWDTEGTEGAYDPTMYDKNDVYKQAHRFAEFVEKEIIEWAGEDWEKYSKRVDDLKIKWQEKT